MVVAILVCLNNENGLKTTLNTNTETDSIELQESEQWEQNEISSAAAAPNGSTEEIVDHEHDVIVNGKSFTQWPKDLYIPPQALEVFLETFQGPLDLLLYLIRKQNLDILNIPVAKITEQYMEYVELMRRFRLDLAAEYLLMAAMLAEIKSRMLLPRQNDEIEDDEEDPRAALVRRLQEYERYSQAAADMDLLPQLERDMFIVSMEFEDPSPQKLQSNATLNDLVVAFRNVVDRAHRNKHWEVGYEALSVREKMSFILGRLRESPFIQFDDLFDPNEGKAGLVVSFMALLELVRDNMVTIVQHEQFSPIHIKQIET